MLKYINSKYSKVKICKFEGCTELYVSRRKTDKYCKKHSEDKNLLRRSRRLATLKKKNTKTVIAKRDASIYARMLSFEEARLKAINSSPDISNLLVFSPDGGKTLIYCKDEEQLNRAKNTFKNIYKR